MGERAGPQRRRRRRRRRSRRRQAHRARSSRCPTARSPGSRVVVAKGDAGPLLALVELDGSGVEVTPVGSIDPSRPASRIAFDGAPRRARSAKRRAARQAILHLLDRAAVLIAFEQIGGAERALEMTREFTLGPLRVRPAGRVVPGDQAPPGRPLRRDRARDARTPTTAPGRSRPAPPSCAVAACGARVAASEAFELAGEEMIQMHGGVGFTWEYDCHLFYRRAKLLSLALGSAGASGATASDRRELDGLRRHMDFNDTPRRGRVPRRGARLARRRTRSCARPARRAPGLLRRARPTSGLIERAKAWQAKKADARLGVHHLAEGVRRPRRVARSRT